MKKVQAKILNLYYHSSKVAEIEAQVESALEPFYQKGFVIQHTYNLDSKKLGHSPVLVILSRDYSIETSHKTIYRPPITFSQAETDKSFVEYQPEDEERDTLMYPKEVIEATKERRFAAPSKTVNSISDFNAYLLAFKSDTENSHALIPVKAQWLQNFFVVHEVHFEQVLTAMKYEFRMSESNGYWFFVIDLDF